jgi:hypothetical protein
MVHVLALLLVRHVLCSELSLAFAHHFLVKHYVFDRFLLPTMMGFANLGSAFLVDVCHL